MEVVLPPVTPIEAVVAHKSTPSGEEGAEVILLPVTPIETARAPVTTPTSEED